ncbi:MAG: ABC transporter permease [Thermoanaerobaculaceae bacterium]|nr:ABC transporter permease [Thermoanaerobaculaceae bacterium]
MGVAAGAGALSTAGVGIQQLLVTLHRQRGLILVLVERELKARYRGTVLGYLWSLLNPILLLAVYSLVFTLVIPARVPTHVPYPLFLFAGLLPWLFASGAMLDASVVLLDNGPLLKKVMCPPEVFPAVTVISHLVHHLLALPVLFVGIGVAVLAGRATFPLTVLLAPLALLPWVVAVSGLVLLIAALAVHFRDLKDLLHNLLSLLFFLTPIIYTPELVPAGMLRRLVLANPVTPMIQVYRDVLLLGRIPPLAVWGWASLVALVCWGLGTAIFMRLRETLVETV